MNKQNQTHDITRRHRLGAVLKAWRAGKGLSAEHAAELAGVAPRTWRRLERGEPVWDKTYIQVDRLFHRDAGAVMHALEDDDALDEFAHDLGIAPAVAAAEPGPTVVLVAELVQRLARDRDRSKAKDDALTALLRVLPELGR